MPILKRSAKVTIFKMLRKIIYLFYRQKYTDKYSIKFQQ